MKMNKLLLVIILLSSIVIGEEKNKIIIDGKSGKPILIGICDREAFVDTNFAWWFNSGYKFYYPNEETINQIKAIDYTYNVTIVMGTWCSDSRRETPRFYKLLDEINFPEEKLTLVNVDRDKNGISFDVSELNIEFVPTFIICKDGVELGRIIESPKNSLEEDFLEIVTSKGIK
jgi:thiol-disulfide isomerase/thioredoxin